MINKDGLIIKGKFPVSANVVCRTDAAGRALYAAHCGGGNTGRIGVALCGMSGFKSRQFVGAYPLTKKQCEAGFKLLAELAKEYKYIITPQTVQTHYEFGKANPKTSSAGKIDIIYLPPYPDIKQDDVGEFIRSKVKWYYSKI